MPGTHQLAVNDQIGRGGDEGHFSADQRCHAQRHHKASGMYAGVAGHAEHCGDENCDHTRGTHERTDTGHDDHEVKNEAGFALTGFPHQQIAQSLGHPSANQSFAHHKQCRD